MSETIRVNLDSVSIRYLSSYSDLKRNVLRSQGDPFGFQERSKAECESTLFENKAKEQRGRGVGM